MAIKLIQQDEKNRVTIDGATFICRRIPSLEQKAIEMCCTKKGIEDKRSIVDEVLRYAVLDWRDVSDPEGQPVPFRADLIPYLPEAAKAALIEHFYENDPTPATLGN